MDLLADAARRLLGAYGGEPIGPVRTNLPAGDVDAAYAVQALQVEQWLAAGRRLVGRKIGLTARSVQAQLGVGEPDFGHLFADMVLASGEEAPFGRLQQPKVEAEIAFVLGRDLNHVDTTVVDAMAAVDWAAPALEIVGSRIAGWDIDIVDTVADNASSGMVVIGGPARRLNGLDLTNCEMSLTLNGVVASTGRGADCLSGPLNALAWLARTSARFGRPLRTGDLVLTGALGPMVAVAPGDRVEAKIEGLGEVSSRFSIEACQKP